MTNLMAARSLMGLSLAFHIVFAVIGMAMPALMTLSEWRWLKHRNPIDRLLAQRWAKGTAILFAVGAVSGTALSFELGLLWPVFMRHAGPIIGMPFSLEGFAFFLEAIFLGIYLYGWERLSERLHLFSGAMVALCGTASGALVVAANSWMNTPQGFDVLWNGAVHTIHSPADWPLDVSLTDVEILRIRPWEAMLTPAFATQAIHTVLSAFAAVGLAAAGVHALMLLREPANRFHQRALALALTLGGVAALLVPISGDFSAKHVAKHQPVKLAAMEGHWETERGAPLLIGGLPDEGAEITRWALPLPKLLSVLAFGAPDAEVRGLRSWPRDERPPVGVTHVAFQLMVAAGTAMAALGALSLVLLWRRHRWLHHLRFLWLCAAVAPLGFVAIEAGWTVTEVGRQPWIVRGMLRTAQAVTPMPHVSASLVAFSLLYATLGIVCVALLRRHVFDSPAEAELEQLVVSSRGSSHA